MGSNWVSEPNRGTNLLSGEPVIISVYIDTLDEQATFTGSIKKYGIQKIMRIIESYQSNFLLRLSNYRSNGISFPWVSIILFLLIPSLFS